MTFKELIMDFDCIRKNYNVINIKTGLIIKNVSITKWPEGTINLLNNDIPPHLLKNDEWDWKSI
jgi:hypothetical protein